jgi:hypothetical protein
MAAFLINLALMAWLITILIYVPLRRKFRRGKDNLLPRPRSEPSTTTNQMDEAGDVSSSVISQSDEQTRLATFTVDSRRLQVEIQRLGSEPK